MWGIKGPYREQVGGGDGGHITAATGSATVPGQAAAPADGGNVSAVADSGPVDGGAAAASGPGPVEGSGDEFGLATSGGPLMFVGSTVVVREDVGVEEAGVAGPSGVSAQNVQEFATVVRSTRGRSCVMQILRLNVLSKPHFLRRTENNLQQQTKAISSEKDSY